MRELLRVSFNIALGVYVHFDTLNELNHKTIYYIVFVNFWFSRMLVFDLVNDVLENKNSLVACIHFSLVMTILTVSRVS